MKRLVTAALLLITGLTAFPQQEKYHDYFYEDFRRSVLKNFQSHTGPAGTDTLLKSGIRLPEERKTRILSMRINPAGAPGAGRGPEISSKYFTHFGTYASRIRIPDVRSVQPNVGGVVGYFTYHVDSDPGLSEIDYEWLIADPQIIYIGTWTGQRGDLRRVGRTINLAKGLIYNTIYKERRSGFERPLTGLQNMPDTIPAIEGYDASAQFYTYGFDWYTDRIRWWMINPATADTVVLWDYRGSQEGIPQNRTHYRLNFWYTDSWPVETNPNSIEKPLYPYETEVDWMSYDPLFTPKKRTD